ncbi:MAG TPA: type II secretion system protein GspM [Bryobacteraceae bacterium]|nr:type II secretion system protein GspM [Bryobacteraceae bacterium]
MTLQDRDKRALVILGVALVLALIYWAFSSSSSRGSAPAKAAAVPVDTSERAEKRLAVLRATAATVDGKQALLKQASAELAVREKGLISGDTPEQAQAQLLQMIRRVARQQNPPLDIRQVELGQPRAYGDAYGQVTVSTSIDCRIDELVNFMASLSEQPEIVATDEVRIGAAHPKQKTMPVRLTISGIVARRLLPEKLLKKGLTEF